MDIESKMGMSLDEITARAKADAKASRQGLGGKKVKKFGAAQNQSRGGNLKTKKMFQFGADGKKGKVVKRTQNERIRKGKFNQMERIGREKNVNQHRRISTPVSQRVFGSKAFSHNGVNMQSRPIYRRNALKFKPNSKNLQNFKQGAVAAPQKKVPGMDLREKNMARAQNVRQQRRNFGVNKRRFGIAAAMGNKDPSRVVAYN